MWRETLTHTHILIIVLIIIQKKRPNDTIRASTDLAVPLVNTKYKLSIYVRCDQRLNKQVRCHIHAKTCWGMITQMDPWRLCTNFGTKSGLAENASRMSWIKYQGLNLSFTSSAKSPIRNSWQSCHEWLLVEKSVTSEHNVWGWTIFGI